MRLPDPAVCIAYVIFALGVAVYSYEIGVKAVQNFQTMAVEASDGCPYFEKCEGE